ncbi:MAG: hypothetical protein HY456_01915 [Parcubacteria group bacterium]|nr:hypothetical protein [Parcubacteria group bacterium]
MKKIFASKNDELSLIAEKIITAEDNEVVLNMPRFSKLGEAAINFDLLKRESDAAHKKLIIESVDEHVLTLAESVGIEAYNPFFQNGRRQRPLSDIIPPSKHSVDRQPRHEPSPAMVGLGSAKAAPREELTVEAQEEVQAPPRPVKLKTVVYGRRTGMKLVFAVVLLVALSIAGYVAAAVLPKSEIAIHLHKSPWSYTGSVKADKSLANFDADRLLVPGALFVEKKNTQLSFAASGKKFVERKAKGIIRIFNAYSSEPQPLVVSTRFETPDGKIFRLDKGVTVPGAKIADGKIVPSNISATVTADKAGAEYNIGPVERFSIPGFKGSPKFDGFYGSSDAAMDGGFVGQQAYPTEADIAAGKETVSRTLADTLRAVVSQQLPQDYVFIDGASISRTVKETVMPDVNREGKFSIIGEAERDTFGFKEADLVAMLKERAKKDLGPDIEVREYKIHYTDAALNNQQSSLSFNAAFEAVFVRSLDREALIRNVSGKKENDAKAVIFSLPGLESANLTFWPFWVRRVPVNQTKIKITVD